MRLLILLFTILLSSTAIAQERYALAPAVIGGAGAGGAAADTNFCAGKTSVFCDDFEGNQTCGDDGASQANCRLAWTVSAVNGTITNQQTGLDGTYAKYLNATDTYNYIISATHDFADANNMYTFVRLKIAKLTTANNGYGFVGLRSDAGTDYCQVGIICADGSCVWRVYNGVTTVSSEVGVAQDTEYCLWLEHERNTATSGCRIYAATVADNACTKPAVSAQTDGRDAQVGKFFVAARNFTSDGGIELISYDNVRGRASAIGDSGGD